MVKGLSVDELLGHISKKTGITDEFLRSVGEETDDHDCHLSPEDSCDHPSHPQV